MTSIILLGIFLGTAATIILIIYLIDRIAQLEDLTLSVQTAAAQKKTEAAPQHPFLCYEGKALWDVMSGNSPEDFDDDDVIALKPRYELLLKKHIEKLFADGIKDGNQGRTTNKPKVPIDITTLRGKFSSWIPQPSAATIYNAGLMSVTATEEDKIALRANLDNAAGMLFSRTDLELQEPFSEALMPTPPNVEAPLLTDPANPDQTPEDDLLGPIT